MITLPFTCMQIKYILWLVCSPALFISGLIFHSLHGNILPVIVAIAFGFVGMFLGTFIYLIEKWVKNELPSWPDILKIRCKCDG